MEHASDRLNPYDKARDTATSAIEAQLADWADKGKIEKDSHLYNHLRGNSLSPVLSFLSFDESEWEKNQRSPCSTNKLAASIKRTDHDTENLISQIVNILPNDFDGNNINKEYTVSAPAITWTNLAIAALTHTGANAANDVINNINDKKTMGAIR